MLLGSDKIREIRFVYKKMLEIHDKEMVDLGSGEKLKSGQEMKVLQELFSI